MPRIGANPNVDELAYQYNDVVLAVITHLPNLEGYHGKRLEIVKACLNSMRHNANVKSTVIVWDNGSCAALREWLEYEYQPNILIQSPNIGKTNARTNLFRMCPSHCIVAYSDDDMLFYPDWLTPQIELLKGFPNVACVSCWPVRTSSRWGVINTLKWAREHAIVDEGRFIPDAWEYDYAISIGRDPGYHADQSAADLDYRVTYNVLQAYVMAQHAQFVSFAPTIADMPFYSSRAMRMQREFDIEMDKRGLRLTTTERLCRHMGNVMDDKIKREIAEMELVYA